MTEDVLSFPAQPGEHTWAVERRAVLFIENDTQGDNLFGPVLAETLREIAALIDGGHPMRDRNCVHRLSNGSKVTLLCHTFEGSAG